MKTQRVISGDSHGGFHRSLSSIDRVHLCVAWATPAQCMAWRVVNGAIRPHHCPLRSLTIYRKEVGLFSLIAFGLEAFHTRRSLGSLKWLCPLSCARQWQVPPWTQSGFLVFQGMQGRECQLFPILWFSVKSLQECCYSFPTHLLTCDLCPFSQFIKLCHYFRQD
jgi:hypothetical protein